jgi:hypothetical protein
MSWPLSREGEREGPAPKAWEGEGLRTVANQVPRGLARVVGSAFHGSSGQTCRG